MSTAFHDRVVATGLPLDQVIVIGSGVLDELGIRTTSDVDMAVSEELYKTLLADSSWQQKTAAWGEIYLEKDDCEVWRGWVMDDSGHPTYEDLLADSVVIDGIRFISLDYLLNWKEQQQRPKDKEDIELIKEYKNARA